MNAETTASGAVAPEPTRFGTVLRTAIAIPAGLAYAFLVWTAVAYLVGMAQLGLNGQGWFVLLFAVLIPMIALGAALLLGWRRKAGEFVLLLLAGLGLSAVFWLNVLSYSVNSGGSLLA